MKFVVIGFDLHLKQDIPQTSIVTTINMMLHESNNENEMISIPLANYGAINDNQYYLLRPKELLNDIKNRVDNIDYYVFALHTQEEAEMFLSILHSREYYSSAAYSKKNQLYFLIHEPSINDSWDKQKTKEIYDLLSEYGTVEKIGIEAKARYRSTEEVRQTYGIEYMKWIYEKAQKEEIG